MRKELELIEQIENYLMNKLSATDKTNFAAEINSNPALESAVNFQRNLVEGIQRMGLKNTTISARKKYRIRKGIKYTIITLFTLFTLAFATIYFLKNTEGAFNLFGSTEKNYCTCYERTENQQENVAYEYATEQGCIDTCHYFYYEVSSEIIYADSVNIIEPEFEHGLKHVDSLETQSAEPILSEVDSDNIINNTNSANETSDVIVAIVDIQPSFLGGEAERNKFIADNFVYPEATNTVEGIVYVQFTVSELGKISAVKVIKGLSKEIDNEAIRVVKLMPDWIPGENKGNIVATNYTLPIHLKIE